MISSTEKIVIITASIYGSLYLFSISLNNLNNIFLQRRNFNLLNYNVSQLNNSIIINGLTMAFSVASFGYFTYIVSE